MKFWLAALCVMLYGLTAQAATYRKAKNGALLNNLTATPGATLPQDTQTVLCSPQFRTGSVRSVTERTKQLVCAEYGVVRARCNGRLYEIDHLISLELGGSNDIKNLWPQPYLAQGGARQKDVVEDALHRQVCRGTLSLAAAQHCIATDWTECGE